MTLYDLEKEPNQNISPESDKDPVKSPEQLEAAENNSGVNGTKAALSDQIGKGFAKAAGPEAAIAYSVLKKAQNFLGRHKKGSAGAGASIGLVGLILIGFSMILPLEIVHIEQNLLGYEAKIEQHFEKKEASKLMQKIINRLRNKTPAEDKQTAAEDAASGEDLSSEIDGFDITNPTIENDLATQGIKVETDPATGAFTGLENSSGQNITNDIGTNSGDFQSIEKALPEWQVGQIESFRPLMVDEAGAVFSGIPPDTPNDKVQTTIEDSVTDGATAADFAAASESETGKTPQPGQSAPAAEIQAADTGGIVGTALEAEDQALQSGASGSAAIQAGVNAIKGSFSNPIFIAGFASTVCSVEESVSKAAKDRIPEIISLLIRHGTTLISLADELKAGQMSAGQLNQVMKIFNGDSSVKPTAHDPNPTAAMPFSSSAAWQRATGGSVDSSVAARNSPSYTPEISPASLPTANSGTVVVDELQGVLNTTHTSFACSALTSPFGFVVQGGVGAVQIFSDIGSLGGTQLAISGAIIAATGLINYVILPHVLEYFSPVGLSGRESSVQWLNNSDAGLNLSMNNYARRLGANPVPNSTADSLYSQANRAQVAANARLPWTNQVFALANPNSLASIILDKLPVGVTANSLAYGALNSIINIPSYIFGDIASVISPTAFAQSTPTNPGEAYGITQYSFTNSEIGQYDPIANEQYLFSKVSFNGKSVSRIDALGNPNTYTDNPSGDPNTNDLLHCYVDSYALIEENINNASNNCGVVGSYDYASSNPTMGSLPNDQTVVNVYCTALGANTNQSLWQTCQQQMPSQVYGHNDAGHFRQYLLDTHIMSDYTSLTNNT